MGAKIRNSDELPGERDVPSSQDNLDESVTQSEVPDTASDSRNPQSATDLWGTKGAIEVKLSKKSMKVSSDAWKAFQIYQQYEDWSSETEKTDYTYSRLSAFHNKEVVPGIPVRPNLCRSPIKPSTKSSLYDYTSENQQNRRNLRHEKTNHTSNSQRNFKEAIVTVEEVSYYRRLVQFLVNLWNLLSTKVSAIFNRVGAAVSYSSSAWASIFVSIWAYTAWAVQSSLSAVQTRWQSFRSKSVSTLSRESGSEWLSDNNLLLIWIKRTKTTITTIVTSYYYSTASVLASPRPRRYIWWLLLPLLLLAGLGGLYCLSINPATIVLSLLNSLYLSTLQLPSTVYSFFLVKVPYFATEALPNFFCSTIPFFLTHSLPDFFCRTVPNAFFAIPWFFTGAVPMFFYTIYALVRNFFSYILNFVLSVLLTMYSSLLTPFGYIDVFYMLEVSYGFIFATLVNATSSIHGFYSWMAVNILYLFSFIQYGLHMIAASIADYLTYICVSLINIFDFSQEIPELQQDEPNIFGIEDALEVPQI